MRRWLEVIRSVFTAALIIGICALGSCTTTRTILKQAPTDLPRGWAPRLHVPLSDDEAKRKLETYFYGRMSFSPDLEIVSEEILSEASFNGAATLKQWRLIINYGAEARSLDLVALTPNAEFDAPIILSQNFCPNHNVVPLEGVRPPDRVGFDCSGGGIAGALMGQVFGRYIVSPPLEDLIARGYGFAAIYPSQFVPDSRTAGLDVLDTLFPNDPNRPGALAVWANLFDITARVLEESYGRRPIIAYGHSRFGKTALMAGAWSSRIDAVVAHQSGTLGASALDDASGEPLKALVESYPHWPGAGVEPYLDHPETLPVRPADLLALLRDKPVLLGNARRDVWSDPWGAFTEAKSAWGEAFTASRPNDFRPDANKAYWLRPGTHGVVKEDWPAFLDYLDANITHQAQRASGQ